MDQGCNTSRAYRFFFFAEVEGRRYEHNHEYPVENAEGITPRGTRETVIDLGDVSRFFDAIEPGPPVTSAPADPSPGSPRGPVVGLDLDGEWIRHDSNNDRNDGMRIMVSGGQAVLTFVPESATRYWLEGEVIWQAIAPDGDLEVLGSNDRYYSAQMKAEGSDRLHIDIAANGAGNDQTWERGARESSSDDGDGGDGGLTFQNELTGTDEPVFEDVEIAEACADQLQLDPAIAAIVDPIVEEEITLQELVGLAVGIVRGGRIVHLKGYGYPDRDYEWPTRTNTLFRWASISKTIPAVAAMQMMEDGELDLDVDIGPLVPEFEEVPNSVITMRQLLGNTAGIEPYPEGFLTRAASYPETTYDPIAALPILNDTLLFTPGTDFDYSTFNFMLAGAALERIARARYGYPTGDYSSAFVQFVQERIADPLCMESFAVDYPRATSPRDAQRYVKDEAGVIGRSTSAQDRVVHWRLPGGGYQSSIRDLALFANALLSQTLLGDDGNLALTQETTTSDGTGVGYAQGLWLQDRETPERFGHGGVQSGVRSHMYVYPTEDLAIVFLTNTSYTNRGRIQDRLLLALDPTSTWPVNDYNLTGSLDCGQNTQLQSDSRFAGVWQEGPANQLLRRGYTTGLFARERGRLRAQGYHLTDLETFVQDGERRWDGVFTRGVPRTRLWRGLSIEEFEAKIAEQRAKGYELADVEVYSRSPGVGTWAGVFEPAPDTRTLLTDRDIVAFEGNWEALADNNHRLVDIEKYEGPNGERWFAGLFVRGSGEHAMDLNIAPEDVEARKADFLRANMYVTEMERYTNGTNPPRWALVASPPTGRQVSRTDMTFCADWNSSPASFWEMHEQMVRQGRALIDFESYPASSD